MCSTDAQNSSNEMDTIDKRKQTPVVCKRRTDGMGFGMSFCCSLIRSLFETRCRMRNVKRRGKRKDIENI